MTAAKGLRVVSVGAKDGQVNLWASPLWLTSDKLAVAVLTAAEARALAIKLLQAAETTS